jgi:hypothetical protein
MNKIRKAIAFAFVLAVSPFALGQGGTPGSSQNQSGSVQGIDAVSSRPWNRWPEYPRGS